MAKKHEPYMVDNDQCVKKIGNRFELILIAGIRARELIRGHVKKVSHNNAHTITALHEIEAGHIGRDYLKKVK